MLGLGNWPLKRRCHERDYTLNLLLLQDNGEHAGMVWLRDKLGYALGLKWVKSLVLIIFTAYLVVSIWGITRYVHTSDYDKQNYT